jgi:hypothetical protein
MGAIGTGEGSYSKIQRGAGGMAQVSLNRAPHLLRQDDHLAHGQPAGVGVTTDPDRRGMPPGRLALTPW